MLDVFKRGFALDLRSLALFRVGLGAMVMLDGLGWLRHHQVFLSDAGATPRDMVAGLSWRFTLHTLSGEAAWPLALSLLTVAAGLALLLGWRTRLSTLAAWLLIISVQARNTLVLYGFDGVLRVLLFWALFLPLAGHLSLDRRAGRARASGPVLTLGSVGLVVQLALIYGVNAVLKLSPRWLDGSALERVLHLDRYAQPLGRWMLDSPGLLQGLTWGTLGLELLGAAALLTLGASSRVRVGLVLAFVALHLGIEATMEVGWFPLVMMVAWLALLPGSVWDRVGWTSGEGTASLLRWPMRATAGLALALTLAWNLAEVGLEPLRPSGPAAAPLRLARLDQRWAMFTHPPRLDRWFVLQGRSGSGEPVDLLRDGAPLSWVEPDNAHALYPDERWRKYLRNLSDDRFAKHREPYLAWACGQHPDVGELSLWVVLQPTVLRGPPAPDERVLLHQRACD